MDAIALPGFPSCYNCLSWSADGELAVAAGEYVHFLTPKSIDDNKEDASARRTGAGNWHIARVRVNLFTSKEWPQLNPQDRSHFSLGREQSTSHVVGLAWSPPGLARYRRSLLAVLTSNLLLSFYEGVAPAKWVRVAIVNHSLESHFSKFIHDESLTFRKAGVRSFSWCPPLRTPAAKEAATPYFVPEPESRWGLHFLTVANDYNDVICLQIRRSGTKPSSVDQYSMDILSLTSVHDLIGHYPGIQTVSLLSTAVKPGLRTTSISCGPWFPRVEGETDAYSVTSLSGVTYGTKLKVLRLDISLTRQGAEAQVDPLYTTAASSTEFSLPKSMLNYHITGILQWISTDAPHNVYLAAGGFTGVVVLPIPYDVYLGKPEAQAGFETQELPLYTSAETHEQQRHWEPIGAMTATADEVHTLLHLGTTGGYTLAKPFPGRPDEPSVSSPWKHQFDELREGYDIDRDLGGLGVGRIWGLASHRGLIATATTLHPGDQVHYGSAASESTNITISPARHGEEGASVLHRRVSDQPPEALRAKRERVIGFTLHAAQGNRDDMWSNRLVYAAACCAIAESENEPLRMRARETLENLATATGADLSEEISKCSTAPTRIEPKSAEQLDGSECQLFEKCDICDAGIAWYAAQESQCAAGHLFVRCNLSFLSIQEPGISNICSNCGTEYLNKERIEPTQRLYGIISDAFDTCIYCDGKFRD